jgi:hypothetical protein
MTAWAKPKDLLIAFKFANESEWRRHLEWLRTEGYPWIHKLEKDRQSLAGRAGSVGALGGTSRDAKHEGEIQEMGDDLLAGGA